MTTRAIEICERFAKEHNLTFTQSGEVGFGRECVGFLRGDNYVDFNPLDRKEYERIEGLQCRAVTDAAPADAYHKHDCLAVLGRGDSAVAQLADWVVKMEAAGKVEIVEYPTGAEGVQAILSGVTAFAVVVTAP